VLRRCGGGSVAVLGPGVTHLWLEAAFVRGAQVLRDERGRVAVVAG